MISNYRRGLMQAIDFGCLLAALLVCELTTLSPELNVFKDYTGAELYKIFESMCQKQEYKPDDETADYIRTYLDTRAKAHEPNFANAREVRNYIERCIERQATRIVSEKEVSDDQLRTLTLPDCKED